MISILIFDYDGVLFDTKDIAFEIISGLWGSRSSKPVSSMHDFIDVYKDNFYRAMEKRGVKKSEISELAKESRKALAGKDLVMFRGIGDVVRRLSENHTLAVVSSNFDSVMRKNLEKKGIDKCFGFIMGTEEGESKMKKIIRLLDSLEAGDAEAVMITDTAGDIKEAKKAGIKTMAVTWGFHPLDVLEKAKPDFIVKKPEEILEVLA